MSRISRRLGAAFAGLALAAVATIGTALPASAHDQLISTTPENGSTVTTVPDVITFEFSGEILPEGFAATITEESDTSTPPTDWTAGAPQVDGFTLTVPVKPDIPSGTYVAAVRVVSSDSHPIQESFTFTLDLPADATPTDAPTPSASAEPTADATAEPTTEPTAEPTSAPDATAAPEAEAQSPLPWVIGGGIAAAVIVALVAILRSQRKK